ncbi:MAG: hypothetical protein KF893_26010 [Caldilineaceae bacterium]|nr:hypothetical protein [Caldilineaceae bacterium]
MSDETFRAVLRQNDYVYERPKHDLQASARQEHEAGRKIIADLKKKAPKTTRSSYSLWTNYPEPPSYLAQMLDETGASASHSCSGPTKSSITFGAYNWHTDPDHLD